MVFKPGHIGTRYSMYVLVEKGSCVNQSSQKSRLLKVIGLFGYGEHHFMFLVIGIGFLLASASALGSRKRYARNCHYPVGGVTLRVVSPIR